MNERRFAFLGPQGSFSEEAARFFFSPEQLIPFRSIPDCLEAVWDGKLTGAVVPIENSIEGSVNMTLDWLIDHQELSITAELTMPIEQQIMGSRHWDPEAVERIYSHPQAVAQCRRFLRESFPAAELVYTNSTSEAALHVSQHPDEPWLAIGTRLAAELYGLQIIREAAQDYPDNRTSFIVVSRTDDWLRRSGKEPVKSSLVVFLPEDYPGALYQVLAAFAWRKLNLTRLVSRPTKRKLGTYHFFMDVEQHAESVLLQGVISEIQALGCGVSLLGSYPCFRK
ncbi:MAG: hypothetical protein BAA01_08935 [Bacillus thermozeamaize]|uniref:Prephenate dehydratase n=1 Tax=Bacillus thermozeamaize TaxID=230954 RepID=A0A1Y3PS93_9BACI|nr:MAG: hypothetical protein BAA01_08935 [Bacillus thermozeamaize]